MNILLRMYPGDAWIFLIVNVFVQVTVVILAARCLARLGSRWNAAWRQSIYLVALICVLASPVLSWVMQTTGITLLALRPSVPTAPPAESARIPMAHEPEAIPIETPATPRLAASRVHLEAESFKQGLRPENPLSLSFPDTFRALAAGALVIWPLGMALLLARWCYGLHLIAALRRAAQPLDCEAMAELLGEVRRALGTDKLPPMAVSAGLDRPVMVGLIRPLVILPEKVLQTLHGPDLADILVHECAHAVCLHQVVGLLQRVAGMLFWPHPLMHVLNRELARAREEVCDNYVLRRSDAPRYARTLLELSQLLVGVSPKSAALGLFHCHWRLEDRVADLLDRRRKLMIRVSRWTTAVLTAIFMLLGLLIAGTRVVQAEAADDKKAETKTEMKAVEVFVASPAPDVENYMAQRIAEPLSSDEERSFYNSALCLDIMNMQGYVMLENASVEEKQGFTKLQQGRLREIANTFIKARQKQPKLRQFSMTEIEAANRRDRQIREAGLKAIEATLTPSQLESLRKLVFRWVAGNDINSQPPQYLDFIGITPEQKKKLQELDRDMAKRRQRESREITDRSLAELNPQQLQRVRTEVEQFYRAAREPVIEKTVDGDSGPVFMLDPYVAKLDAESDDDAWGALPVYEELAQGVVRKTLGLSVDQRKELQKIADEYRTKMEGPAGAGEIETKRTRLASEVRQQIEHLLTPQQFTILKDIVFRTTLPFALADPMFQEKMQLSPEQKERLNLIGQDEREMMYRVSQERNEKAFALLTPEQKEKLRREIIRREINH